MVIWACGFKISTLLHFCLQNQTEDGLRKELIALQEDKHNYETTAKESLRRVLQEKIEVVRKLSEVEVFIICILAMFLKLGFATIPWKQNINMSTFLLLFAVFCLSWDLFPDSEI